MALGAGMEVSFWGDGQTFPCKFIWCNVSHQRCLPWSTVKTTALRSQWSERRTSVQHSPKSAWVNSAVARAKPNGCA